jgi:hypothetical protein
MTNSETSLHRTCTIPRIQRGELLAIVNIGFVASALGRCHTWILAQYVKPDLAARPDGYTTGVDLAQGGTTMPGCRTIFANELPSEWNVTIVGIGAKYFYRSGKDYQTSKQVELKSQQTDNIDSDSPNDCVGSVMAIVLVSQPGQSIKTLTKTVPAEPNQCLVDVKIALCASADLSRSYESIDETLRSRGFVLERSGSESKGR